MIKNLVQVQAILFRKKEDYEFLVLKRVPEKYGFWQPVTGGKEDEEEVKDAVVREVLEEVGAEKEDLLEVIDLDYHFEWDGKKKHGPEPVHFDEYGFGVRVKEDFEPKLSKEHEEYKWCRYEEALGLIFHETNKETLRRLNGHLH